MTKVLVVDDSALMRRLLGGVLTEAGYDVDTSAQWRRGPGAADRLVSPMS
jgi:CheY-like chemotaxis protein